MTDKIRNVLFPCTGNSARSILAEAILDRLGKGRFKAASAGSQPKGAVNPHAIALLSKLGYDTAGFRSKSWDEFAGAGTPPFDLIVTVCDNAAGEACPVWPGRPAAAHWGIADPAAATGSDADIAAAFGEAYRLLSLRIQAFVDLPLDSLDGPALKAKLAEIGRLDGATEKARKGI